MQAQLIALDLFLDENHIEFVEKDLPLVVNPQSPVHLAIDYNPEDKTFTCEASYKCRDEEIGYVQIRRQYTIDILSEVALMYGTELDNLDDIVDNG